MKARNKFAVGLIGIASMFVSVTALALNWSNAVLLSGVDVEATGTSGAQLIWIGTKTKPTGLPSACSNPPEYLLSGSADAVKSMTNTATAMYLAGQPVKLLFNGSCSGSYPLVVGISNF